MRVLPMGPTACLIADLTNPAAWTIGFRALRPAGVVEVVPAARTVLIVCSDEDALGEALELAGAVTDDTSTVGHRELVSLPVTYDGPDLSEVAAAVGRSTDEVIHIHSGAEYLVGFCGFAPGFAYLTGLPSGLWVPRRDEPRVRVPAGSVAISAEYSAVYPSESPGGWHLIGTCAESLFDLALDPPALLTPGTRVRFVA